MEMLMTLESSETFWKPLEIRPKATRELILKERCLNCNQLPKGNEKIDYVELSNGAIKVWHYRDSQGGSTCEINN